MKFGISPFGQIAKFLSQLISFKGQCVKFQNLSVLPRSHLFKFPKSSALHCGQCANFLNLPVLPKGRLAKFPNLPALPCGHWLKFQNLRISPDERRIILFAYYSCDESSPKVFASESSSARESAIPVTFFMFSLFEFAPKLFM